MSAQTELKKLKLLSSSPTEDRSAWLTSAEEGVEFLKQNAASDHIVIYASMPHVLIHAVLVSKDSVTPADQEDLLRAHVDAGDSWCIQRSYGGGEGHRVYLQPALSHPSCRSLVGGEKLIYYRPFHGLRTYRPQIELSQKLVHSLDLYFLEERQAYCRLDERGDLEDVINVFREQPDNPYDRSDVVTIRTKELAEYMALSGLALVRKFDMTRVPPGGFAHWEHAQRSNPAAPDLFYNGGVVPGQASYVNGCQIISTSLTEEDLAEAWKSSLDPANKQYETFKVVDWKNKIQAEVSCAPDALSNYFVKSDKPFETSPAFFRPEVLQKYKSDPDKYELRDRSISCRNAWHLQTYDINDAGQVHTYICYLSGLPYEEQQYWKTFNEWPKAPISKRAFQTDFEGRWTTEKDPLQEIKRTVADLDKRKPRWWNVRGEELARLVLYPATDSIKEWGDELLSLDQLIVEGFVTTELRTTAKRVGVSIEPMWASLRIIDALLVGLGLPADEARSAVDPLRTLHNLRTQVKGHSSLDARRKLARAALLEFGTLRGHFQNLARDCDTSLSRIVAALDSVGAA